MLWFSSLRENGKKNHKAFATTKLKKRRKIVNDDEMRNYFAANEKLFAWKSIAQPREKISHLEKENFFEYYICLLRWANMKCAWSVLFEWVAKTVYIRYVYSICIERVVLFSLIWAETNNGAFLIHGNVCVSVTLRVFCVMQTRK